jgi:hypothetical protein
MGMSGRHTPEEDGVIGLGRLGLAGGLGYAAGARQSR